MNEMWSENRYLNLVINILLFLAGINFLHLGQLILPVICFLLFIENRFQFKVNSPRTFIVLCLFGVSFYAFSHQLGFYSVMGFTLPMAYYIGSNIKDPSEEKIKKLIYLFAIAMASHVILNAVAELYLHGIHGFFNSSTHYDFWTRDKIANTQTAVNADILIGCIYYLLFHEKNRKWKNFCLIVFVLNMFYLLVIGRRTPVILLFLSLILAFIYEAFVLKSVSEKRKRQFFSLLLIGIACIACVILVYSFDLFHLRAVLDETHIVHKFKQGLLNDERFRLYFGSFRLMPKYPFGGQKISAELGEQIHDLWIDVYDYAGAITCGLIILYSVLAASVILRMYRNSIFSKDLKTFCFGVFVCIVTQMFVEPIMTGSSLFMLVTVIVIAVIERRLIHE